MRLTFTPEEIAEMQIFDSMLDDLGNVRTDICESTVRKIRKCYDRKLSVRQTAAITGVYYGTVTSFFRRFRKGEKRLEKYLAVK